MGAGRAPAPPPSLPCCRGALGGAEPAQRPQCPRLVETDPFSTTAQECGSRWSSRCWKEGLQPVSPSKKNTSPAHQGKGAEAAPTQQDLWAPAGWKKSNEHFSKSSLCQKLQSDRCKSQPDPQLLPLLSQPRAASEVTSHLRLWGWPWGRCRWRWEHHWHHPGLVSAAGQAGGGLAGGCTGGNITWGWFWRSSDEHRAHLQKKLELGRG